jgi:hypothetical protein
MELQSQFSNEETGGQQQERHPLTLSSPIEVETKKEEIKVCLLYSKTYVNLICLES